MPGLNYDQDVLPTTGPFALPITEPTLFYDGTPGRELVQCRDCPYPADALFGDHFGLCIDPEVKKANTRHRVAIKRGARRRGSAPAGTVDPDLDVIRRTAVAHEFLSANTVRAELEARGVDLSKRSGSLWRSAVARDWVVEVGEEDGTESAHGKRIKRYRSLIFRRAAEDTL